MHQSFPSRADPTPAESVSPSATPEAAPTGRESPGPAAGSGGARGRPEEPSPEPGPWPAVRPALLGDPLPDLPEADAVGFAAVRRDWEARLTPIDEAERAVSDTLACAAWRRRRLDAVDERVLRALAEGRVPAGMPSLSALIRYRARLAKDGEVLKAELRWLWGLRPMAISFRNRNPARRDWILEMVSLIRPGWRPGTRYAAPEAADGESGPEPVDLAATRAPTGEPTPAEPATAGRAAASAPDRPPRPEPERTGSASPSRADPSLRSEPARAPQSAAPMPEPRTEAAKSGPAMTASRPTSSPPPHEPQPTSGPGVTAPAPTDRAPAGAAGADPGGAPPARRAQVAPEPPRGPSPQQEEPGGPPLPPFARAAYERPVPTLASLRAAVAAAARRAASG